MACENLEDVVGTAITVHKNLGELYRHRAEAAGTDHEREFFEALANGQMSETRRMVRDMARLQDY